MERGIIPLLFNSYEFIFLFAPVALAGYWLLRKNTHRLWWLAAASYVFYGSFDLRFVPFLLGITLVNYWAGQRIATSARPPRWLLLSLAASLGTLAVLKYYHWGAAWLSARFLTSDGALLPPLEFVLPVGISFYVFQSLTYPLDLYFRRTETAPSFLQFAAFVSLFPSVLSGPISRWRQLGPALASLPARLTGDRFVDGLAFFVIGLSKKVLIADFLAQHLVEPLCAAPQGFFLAWIAVVAFTVQLYFDFSGYSDMAIGLGRLLGLDLPRNFASPYQARNISDFWQRWHISLSTWFRDYLFFPLSRDLLRRTGQRHADLVRAAAHLVTMGLIGLWHGAGWNFVLWGLYHGVLLAVHQQTRGWRKLRWGWVNNLLTLLAVMVGWAMFQSESAGQALHMLTSMAGLNGFEPLSGLGQTVNGVVVVFAFVTLAALLIRRPDRWPRTLPRTAYVALLLGMLAFLNLWTLSGFQEQPFVYFVF